MIRLKLANLLIARGFVHKRGKRAGTLCASRAAAWLGVQLYQVQRYVNYAGGCNLATLEKLCDKLECDPSDLIEYIPDDPARRFNTEAVGAIEYKPNISKDQYVSLDW